jgi:glutathione S-transferase
MIFYFAPGACSLGIHFLLEEIGAPYEGVPVQIKDGAQFQEPYVSINPKSKVPALLRDDGTLLTEFGAIAPWAALSLAPDRFTPADINEAARITETLDYIVGTVHMQGFSRTFRPAKFTPNDADHDWVRSEGLKIVTRAMQHLSAQLGDRAFIMGDRLSIADAAFFYTLFWSTQRAKLDLPDNLIAYYKRLSARPAAERAMSLEGLI